MPEQKYKVKLSREEAFSTDRVIAQFERKVTSVVGSSMTASLHVEACSGAHVGWKGLFTPPESILAASMLPRAVLRPQEGEHILANILDPANSCIMLATSPVHLGSFRTLPERDWSQGQSGTGKKKRLVLLKHKRNFILPAPHLGCVSVYNGDQGLKVKHKDSIKDKTHTHKHKVQQWEEISKTVGAFGEHIHLQNPKKQ